MIGKQVLDSNSVKGNHVYFDAFANYRETYGSFLYDIQYAIYDSINKLYSYTKYEQNPVLTPFDGLQNFRPYN